MVRTHKSRKRKYAGTRTYGRGNTKKGRGSGCRGGKGRGGARKHKKTYTYKYEKKFYGRNGFRNPSIVKKIDKINLSSISRLIANGKISKKDNIFYYKFDGKVLGAGTLLFPAVIEAKQFSKSAVDKIEQVGGEARLLSDKK